MQLLTQLKGLFAGGLVFVCAVACSSETTTTDRASAPTQVGSAASSVPASPTSIDSEPTPNVGTPSDDEQPALEAPQEPCSLLAKSPTARELQNPGEWEDLPAESFGPGSWTVGCAAASELPSLGMKLEGFPTAEEADVRSGTGADWSAGKFVDGYGDAAYLFDRPDDEESQAVMSVGRLRLTFGLIKNADKRVLMVLSELTPVLRSLQQ